MGERQKPITIKNVAQPTGEQRKVLGRGMLDWYKWRVWVDAPPEKLAEIESVEYLLHPTFPQPRHVSTDRNNNFDLIGSGWGEFWIEATIVFKDFHEEHIRHWLNLDERGQVLPRSQ